MERSTDMTRAECRSKYFDGSEKPRMCVIVSLATRGSLGRSIISILRFGESISNLTSQAGRRGTLNQRTRLGGGVTDTINRRHGWCLVRTLDREKWDGPYR